MSITSPWLELRGGGMSERDLCIQIPFLCGLPEKQAFRESKINELIFDYEFSNPSSEFKKFNDETQLERISYGFRWVKFLSDKTMIDKALYAWDLLAYRAECCNGAADFAWKKELLKTEEKYPDIACLLTVEQASVQSFWNGG
jgi:hypothetical protein